MKIECIVLGGDIGIQIIERVIRENVVTAAVTGNALVRNSNQIIEVQRRNCGTWNEVWVEDAALKILQGQQAPCRISIRSISKP